MGGVFSRLALVCAAGFLAFPAAAWAPETRVAMVDEAVRLLPGALSEAMRGHRRDLLAGMLERLTADGPDRRAPWQGGRLELALAQDARDLERALGEPTAFGQVALRFGQLASDVLDAGFPPGVSRGDGSVRYAHFASFCDSRRARFPLVFYGHNDPHLARADYAGFALGIMQRASADDHELARAYAAAGTPPSPAAFDDRSVPFALGSLAYSRTVNDIVRVWLDVWGRAGGDMARTPYRGLEPRQHEPAQETP